MSEQQRTREEAYAVSWEALYLAQNIDYDVKMCDPNFLKRRFRWFANRTLLAEMKDRQRRLENYRDQAYALMNTVSDWANEYPLEGENK